MVADAGASVFTSTAITFVGWSMFFGALARLAIAPSGLLKSMSGIMPALAFAALDEDTRSVAYNWYPSSESSTWWFPFRSIVTLFGVTPLGILSTRIAAPGGVLTMGTPIEIGGDEHPAKIIVATAQKAVSDVRVFMVCCILKSFMRDCSGLVSSLHLGGDCVKTFRNCP